MRFKKSLIRAALATCTVAFSSGANAATGATVYTYVNPNHYVECLVLNEFSNEVKGYFEIDERSENSVTGHTRTQIVISQRLVGNDFIFDRYTASRTGNGFTLATTSQDGLISEQQLTRSTAEKANVSLRTFALSARRSRALSDLKAATTELRGRGNAAEQTPISTLARAQVRLDAAVAKERDLQMQADSLWRVANDLRASADALTESSGVSSERNESIEIAMENADQAERKARFAQRLATLAAAEITADEGDVAATRRRIAGLQARIEASAAVLKSTGDLADR